MKKLALVMVALWFGNLLVFFAAFYQWLFTHHAFLTGDGFIWLIALLITTAAPVGLCLAEILE